MNSEQLIKKKKALKKEQRQIKIKSFLSNKLAFTGFIIIGIALIISVFAPLIVTHDPFTVDPINRIQGMSKEHWFGTDDFGRDLFSRVIYGTQVSMKVGILVTLIASIIGTTIGIYAAYYRFLDHILMRISDGLMAFPAILFAIAILATLGPSMNNVIISLSIVFTPYVARIVRSAALLVKEQTYIEALKALGASSTRIIWLHILPNTLSPLIVQATYIFALSIITEAMLSFLGAGVPAPDPSLGNILYDGKDIMASAWWMILFPGSIIVLIVLGLNMFGDGVRDLLDPHSSK